MANNTQERNRSFLVAETGLSTGIANRPLLDAAVATGLMQQGDTTIKTPDSTAAAGNTYSAGAHYDVTYVGMSGPPLGWSESFGTHRVNVASTGYSRAALAGTVVGPSTNTGEAVLNAGAWFPLKKTE
jgi:hypothetical protein